MPVEKEQRTQIIGDYRVHGTDTGSPEVQVALLTERINQPHRAPQDRTRTTITRGADY